MFLFKSFPPLGVPKGEHSESGLRNLCMVDLATAPSCLHFGLLCSPPVEMTVEQIHGIDFAK